MSNTFTITQIPKSKNIFLYPNGSSATELTAYGETENWECVDEDYKILDEDTYVYSSATSVVSDLYTVENHTTETYDINYVSIYTKAKSVTYAQSSNGVFDILYGDGFGNTVKSSDATYGKNINLNTVYSTNYIVHKSRPTDGVEWSWTDIDNMLIGVRCSSPTVSAKKVLITYRPNNTTTFNNHKLHYGRNVGAPAVTNYTYINDEVPNDYIEWVGTSGTTGALDLHDITTSTTTLSGSTIDKVTVFIKAGLSMNEGSVKIAIGVDGNTHLSDGFSIPCESWKNFSHSWTTNPETGNPWKWHEIEALKAGYKCFRGWGSYEGYAGVTQMYVIVHTSVDVNPEIRTTQCFAKINYQEPYSTVTLNNPSSYTLGHSREIKKLNFWNDDRVVYDLQRSSKYLTMNGMEWDTTESEATDKMNDLRDFVESGTSIAIEGMDDGNLNKDWYIVDFNWNRDENNTNICNWSLTFEEA